MAPISVVPVGKKRCRPFLLEVLVMNPEADFKFQLLVEKGCTDENDPVWKLVFDLFKRNSKGDLAQIVHVSFRAETPEEVAGIESAVINGVGKKQTDVVLKEVHPVAKRIGESGESDPAAEKKLLQSMRKVATIGN